MSSQASASLFCSCARRFRSSVAHACAFSLLLACTTAPLPFCSADACCLHAFSSSAPQLERLSMCSRSSSHVITPGVASGCTKLGQLQFGYDPTFLHMSSQASASLFCSCARRFKSSVAHACAFSVLLAFSTACSPFCKADACCLHAFSSSAPQLDKLSMCSRSSSHVITPGVESGCTKLGQLQFGYDRTPRR